MLSPRQLPFLDANFPWFLAGGWAIDLYIGHQTRDHADVDFGIFRKDQLLLRNHLSDWSFKKIVSGQGVAWEQDEVLNLPIHEVIAEKLDLGRIEILLNETHGQDWIYRRDPRITMPLVSAVFDSKFGIPILAPEIVILFKSKNTRTKDILDLESVLPLFSRHQREWLKNSLIIQDPLHAWCALL